MILRDPFVVNFPTDGNPEYVVRPPAPIGHKVEAQADPLALPLNEYQCCHVDIGYEQKEGAPKGVNVPTFLRCTNSINDGGNGYLCPYHDRVLLTPKLSKADLANILWYDNDREVEGCRVRDWDIVEGIILQDRREMAKFPIKRHYGLRIHASPTPPPLKDKSGKAKTIVVQPEWEKVNLNQKLV